MSRPPRTKKDDAPPADEAEVLVAPIDRVSRHIRPLGPRVLVRVLKSPDRSEAGLFLPQGVKDAHSSALLGEVVEVARTMPKAPLVPDDDDDDGDDDDDAKPDADLGKNVSGVPLGANVLVPEGSRLRGAVGQVAAGSRGPLGARERHIIRRRDQ